MKVKLLSIDNVIFCLLNMIIVIDMLNGYLVHNHYDFISVSQIYKGIIIVLVMLRILYSNEKTGIVIILSYFLLLSLASLNGFVSHMNIKWIQQDLAKNVKWINYLIFFFYFKYLIITNQEGIALKIKKFVFISCLAIVFNQIVGILGYGKAFYHLGFANELGTKGFIIAGNELSLLVLVLYAILGRYYFKTKKKFFLVSSIFFLLSLSIASKTSMGGVILIFIGIYFIDVIVKVRLKKAIYFLFLIIPLIFGVTLFLVNSDKLMSRIRFSFEISDGNVLTALLSHRNKYLESNFQILNEKYSLFDKIIGKGESYYLSLTSGQVTEIDMFDLLFTGGFISLVFSYLILCFILVNIFIKVLKKYVYAPFCLFMLIFLIILSNTSGHVFNSGVSGIFLGLFLSLTYVKNERNIRY